MINDFEPEKMNLTKYIFFTGKGGVGKTSTACATAVSLSDSGKKVLLISTDPASNLQDVFNKEIDNKGIEIEDVPNLVVINLNPIKSAKEYKESVIEPYIGKLPDSVIKNMEEQLSGSCTTEIAAFNEFTMYITDYNLCEKYDHIIFDTAPTGHTLRLLQLPSAWTNFIQDNPNGASCLGQLAGLAEKKDKYKKAVEILKNKSMTTLIIVSKPEEVPLIEAQRSSNELGNLQINNQIIIINGILMEYDDKISKSLYEKQQKALNMMPDGLKNLKSYTIPLRGYNITGVENVRSLLNESKLKYNSDKLNVKEILEIEKMIDDIYTSNKKVVFTMGKGGVGKTTIAAAIALGLSRKGKKVHLTTTDPANHINLIICEDSNIELSHIDEKEELEKYKEKVLSKARKILNDKDIEYIEEDLKSPCTQEIAVFNAFAEIVEKADNEIVVIDTAPTGHTILLLDSTQSYNKEIQRNQGDIPESVIKLLPRLKDETQTEVVIVTLPEATPVYEAMRLQEDLKRAEIRNKWWVINQSLYMTKTTNEMLKVRANNEIKWINQVSRISEENFVIIGWNYKDIKEEILLEL